MGAFFFSAMIEEAEEVRVAGVLLEFSGTVGMAQEELLVKDLSDYNISPKSQIQGSHV